MSEIVKEIYCEIGCGGTWLVRDKATNVILTEDLEEESAKELVRRWNAFEEGGSHDALLKACKFCMERYEGGITDTERKLFPRTAEEYDMVKAAMAAGRK